MHEALSGSSLKHLSEIIAGVRKSVRKEKRDVGTLISVGAAAKIVVCLSGRMISNMHYPSYRRKAYSRGEIGAPVVTGLIPAY